MSDDEFDNIPDPFADVQGIDWAGLLARPSGPSQMHPSQAPAAPESNPTNLPRGPNDSTSSSHYFSDGEELDASFLAELARVEEQVTRSHSGQQSSATSIASGSGQGPHSEPRSTRFRPAHGNSASSDPAHGGPAIHTSSEQRVSHYFANQTTEASSSRVVSGTSDADPIQIPNVSSKRPRSDDDTLAPPSPKRKGKMRADNTLSEILSAYEDELTCPICCDLLVASHLANPCGHSFCGECGWQWHVEKKNKGCPCCRKNLDEHLPMIPNIALDNTVERHIKALVLNSALEWEPGGAKYIEWDSRRQKWRSGLAKREAQRARQKPKPVTIGAIQVFDIPLELQEFLDDVNDPNYEDSDVELIPRPIQRARRRHRRARRVVDVAH